MVVSTWLGDHQERSCLTTQPHTSQKCVITYSLLTQLLTDRETLRVAAFSCLLAIRNASRELMGVWRTWNTTRCPPINHNYIMSWYRMRKKNFIIVSAADLLTDCLHKLADNQIYNSKPVILSNLSCCLSVFSRHKHAVHPRFSRYI